MNPKQGDSVKITLQGINAEGEILSETTSQWFGFDNRMANQAEILIIEQITNLIRAFAEEKSKTLGGK